MRRASSMSLLLSEGDVDEHHVWPEQLGLPERVSAGRGKPGDRQTLSFENCSGRLQQSRLSSTP